MADDKNSLRSNSSVLVDGPSRAPARAMLKAVGFTDEDLSKPLIAVAHTWIEIMPCTAHLRDLAEHVKRGIRAAGATPIEFNTIAVCDGISMGTHGMRASLISREVIADSIELTVRGHLFDGVVAMSGCDKTIPATVMALQRLDLPSLMIYGGSIQPGRFGDQQVSIQDVFEAVGAHSAGKMKLEDLKKLEDVACPGVGACGGQFTANTMATATELAGNLADGLEQHSGDGSEKAGERVPGGAARGRFAQAQTQAEPDNHEEGDRERDRVGRDDRRLDQRGAASARYRARGWNRARYR